MQNPSGLKFAVLGLCGTKSTEFQVDAICPSTSVAFLFCFLLLCRNKEKWGHIFRYRLISRYEIQVYNAIWTMYVCLPSLWEHINVEDINFSTRIWFYWFQKFLVQSKPSIISTESMRSPRFKSWLHPLWAVWSKYFWDLIFFICRVQQIIIPNL